MVNIFTIILSSLLQRRKVIENSFVFFLVFIFFFTEFGGRLDAEALTEFVDAGGNILVAGSNLIGKNIIYIFHSIQ
jgi:hypothetical protein